MRFSLLFTLATALVGVAVAGTVATTTTTALSAGATAGVSVSASASTMVQSLQRLAELSESLVQPAQSLSIVNAVLLLLGLGPWAVIITSPSSSTLIPYHNC
jgi:hypothetical protein